MAKTKQSLGVKTATFFCHSAGHITNTESCEFRS